jgi:hypothetical protein
MRGPASWNDLEETHTRPTHELRGTCFQILIMHLANVSETDHSKSRPVRLPYQPPANSINLSQQTSHQQSASSTFLSEQISTSHQTPAKRTAETCVAFEFFIW